jgi:hypothetical protein
MSEEIFGAFGRCPIAARRIHCFRLDALMERRLALHSIRALNWVFPKCQKWSGLETPSISDPSLVFITAERSSHSLPSEFFPASYRRRIEAVLKEKIPGLKIVEKHKSHD